MTPASESAVPGAREDRGTPTKRLVGTLLGCSGGTALLFAGLWLVGLMTDGTGSRRCEIANSADEAADVSVWISGKAFSVSGLAPRETFAFEYRAGGEDAYLIKVSFPSGEGYTTTEGYVDSNGYTDRIILHREAVEFDGYREYAPIPKP
jgi:hypothetical protein